MKLINILLIVSLILVLSSIGIVKKSHVNIVPVENPIERSF